MEKGGDGSDLHAIAQGQTTKIHVATDLLGRPTILRLTAVNVADVTTAGPLMDAAGRVRYPIADKATTGDILMQLTTVGLDLAKPVFQLHGVDEEGVTVLKKKLRRRDVMTFFQSVPPCLFGMEWSSPV